MNELSTLSASEALPALRDGSLTVETYARACLGRIADREPDVQAWAFIDPDAVIVSAKALDAKPVRGPLHGVPVAIKDIILTEDMPTTYNSPLYVGHAPRVDAACVALLRQAGALILGKTHTVEFAATGAPPPTRNPHDRERTPGGSSSGSAAAVADFHAPLALGTQTGGSMIRPASFCGVYAIKPTWGVVSRDGIKPFGPTLDTIGWFGRSAADLELLFNVFDAGQCTPMRPAFSLRGSRIAVCRSPVWSQADVATIEALQLATEGLARAGAEVVDLELPARFTDLSTHHGVIMTLEGRVSFLADYRAAPQALHPNLRAIVENTGGLSARDLTLAYDAAAACREAFDALAGAYDAVLTPSVIGEAPVGLGHTGSMAFNAIWTLLHTPCVNVPGLTGPCGMPVGLTLTGPRYTDRKVLAVADAVGSLLNQATAAR